MESLNHLLTIIVGGLAVWRVASIVGAEEGPFNIFGRFRTLIGVTYKQTDNTFAKGIICIWCNSVWFAFLLSIFMTSTILMLIVYTFAMSTIAVIIQQKAAH